MYALEILILSGNAIGDHGVTELSRALTITFDKQARAKTRTAALHKNAGMYLSSKKVGSWSSVKQDEDDDAAWRDYGGLHTLSLAGNRATAKSLLPFLSAHMANAGRSKAGGRLKWLSIHNNYLGKKKDRVGIRGEGYEECYAFLLEQGYIVKPPENKVSSPSAQEDKSAMCVMEYEGPCVSVVEDKAKLQRDESVNSFASDPAAGVEDVNVGEIVKSVVVL